MLRSMPKDMKSKIEKGQYKVVASAPSWLGGNSEFQVLKWNNKPNVDPYIMVIVSNPKHKPMEVFAYYGTHPSPKAIQFAKSNGLLESVEEAAIDLARVPLRTPKVKTGIKKSTGIRLVLPNAPEVKAKMNRVLKKDPKFRRQMANLVVDRETRGKDLVLYFKSTRGREKFHQLLNMTEEFNLDEAKDSAYDQMMKWYKSSDEKKVYDILKKNKFVLPPEGFTLVQNMLKKFRNHVRNAADEIMLKYPKFQKESVELDEVGRGRYGSKISKGRQDYLKSPEGKASLKKRKEMDARTTGRPMGVPGKLKVKGKFTAAQLKQLRDAYAKIGSINPESKSYKKMTDYLDSLDKNQLKQLSGAKIPFISRLALNRQTKKESVELDEAPTMKMNFKFPTDRNAKDFAYDISNAAVATGKVVGNKVYVQHPLNDRNAHKAISKYMKKNRGELLKENLDERKMTKPEVKKKEEIVKALKRTKGNFDKLYGDAAKNVMYATATKNAMKDHVEEAKTNFKTSFYRAKDALVAAGIPNMGEKNTTPPKLKVHPKFKKKAEAIMKKFTGVSLEINHRMPEKPMKESVELDEAWTADSVMKNATIGSKKGYGINIKKTGGITKTPYKHMLMTNRPDKSVRVTFDHGKDEFEGTPKSVALHLNKILGIKESVELDERRLRNDVYAIVDRKGKVVAANLIQKNAHKEISRHRDGTIVLDPNAKVGDVLKTYASESVELGEDNVKALIAKYNKAGRTAHHYPRKKQISLDGRTMSEKDAIKKMKSVLGEAIGDGAKKSKQSRKVDVAISQISRSMDKKYGKRKPSRDPRTERERIKSAAFQITKLGGKPEEMKKRKDDVFQKTKDIRNAEKLLRKKKELAKKREQLSKERQKLDDGVQENHASLADRRAYLKKTVDDRKARVKARREMIKKGRASVGDGKDVDHVNGNPQDNSSANVRVTSVNHNRGRNNNEEHGAGEEGTKKLLKKYKKDTPYSGGY